MNSNTLLQIIAHIKAQSEEHKKNIKTYKTNILALRNNLNSFETELKRTQDRFVYLSRHVDQNSIKDLRPVKMRLAS